MSTAISIKNVSKKYAIGKQKDGSLRGTLAGMFSRGKTNSKEFLALNNVSFDIQQGEVVGIIGKNGAGKSTLLKILSQITKPTNGSIEINGRIASLLEVGTGFHPELTGRENIYLNGTILGMTRKEVKAKFDEIVAFSGVEKFIDTPVKHYSSGMYVRLAFAVAAHLEPEILIIDEVLAVGDAEFQKKCLGKMKDVAGDGRTVFFVSHNLSAVKSLCNRGILMDRGEKIYDGNVDKAIDIYSKKNNLKLRLFDTKDFSIRSRGTHHVFIKSVELNKVHFFSEDKFKIAVQLDKQLDDTEFKDLNIMVFIFDGLMNTIYQLSSNFGYNNIQFDSNFIYEFTMNPLRLNTGQYSIGIWLGANGFEQDYVSGDICFEVSKSSLYLNKSQDIVSIIQPEFEFNTLINA